MKLAWPEMDLLARLWESNSNDFKWPKCNPDTTIWVSDDGRSWCDYDHHNQYQNDTINFELFMYRSSVACHVHCATRCPVRSENGIT